MKPGVLTSLAVIALTGPQAALAAPPVIDGVALPGVPVAVTDPPPRGTPTGSGKLSQGAAAPLDSAFADAPTYEDHRVDITVVPGIAELVPVARGYFNRFVTPFDNPKVVTVNPIEFHQEGRSVFVATNAESSVGLYILPSDPDDERAISLALVPRSIPPRTVRLH